MCKCHSRKFSIGVAIGLIGLLAAGPVGTTAKRSDSVVRVNGAIVRQGHGKTEMEIRLVIDPGWHIYANSVGKDFPGVATTVQLESQPAPVDVKIAYPAGQLVRDAFVGDHAIYEGTVRLGLTATWPPGGWPNSYDLLVRLQACSKQKCLLPATVKIHLP
jgi:DsbC/DsbD-like thiol-disulfide interchange protein